MIAAAAAVVAGAWARCLRACLAAWLASCASLVRFVHTSCAAALAAARWSAGAAWVGASAVAVRGTVPAYLRPPPGGVVRASAFTVPCRARHGEGRRSLLRVAWCR